MAQLSVVIGTLNRGEQLERALRSLIAQRCAPGALDVIVVDNGSVDDSSARVARLAASAPQIRYVIEPETGLSAARNRGLEEASADLVAFLDDDAEADEEWVSRLIAVFRANPDVGAAGGRTVVRWPGARPAWVSANLEAYYGRCDYGDSARDLAYPDYPFGSNMAFRKALLADLGGFCTDLGARGDNLMGGEETEVFERLHARGVRVHYDPALLVHHWTTVERVSRRWSLRRSFKHGLTMSTMRFVKGSRGLENWSGPLARAVQRTTIGAISTLTALASRRGPATVMSRGANTVYWAGYARGAFVNAFSRGASAPETRRRQVGRVLLEWID